MKHDVDPLKCFQIGIYFCADKVTRIKYLYYASVIYIRKCDERNIKLLRASENKTFYCIQIADIPKRVT